MTCSESDMIHPEGGALGRLRSVNSEGRHRVACDHYFFRNAKLTGRF